MNSQWFAGLQSFYEQYHSMIFLIAGLIGLAITVVVALVFMGIECERDIDNIINGRDE